MSNAWDKAKEMAEQHASSLFVRLSNDSDKIVGVFLGSPIPGAPRGGLPSAWGA